MAVSRQDVYSFILKLEINGYEGSIDHLVNLVLPEMAKMLIVREQSFSIGWWHR